GSSGLAAAAVMTPAGSAVHCRQGTRNLRLVPWPCAGAVRAACSGGVLARALGHGGRVEDGIGIAMGVALMIAAAGLVLRGRLARRRSGGTPEGDGATAPEITVRSEEHTSELQSRENLVCRLLLEKKTDA